jgi:sulfur carrier protein
MSFTIQLNGSPRDFANLTPPVMLAQLIAELQLKSDRIAVELNDAIIERARWPETPLSAGDRIEIVHFVGGGTPGAGSARLRFEGK